MLPKATLVNKVTDCPISKGAASRSYRKPYVVRKSREKWSSEEHGRFVEAVRRFGRDWSAIVHFVGTRSVAQVRSHAQKYFLKLQHQGKADAVPPPRPKRRSTRPYPVQQQRLSIDHSLIGSLQSLPSSSSQDLAHEDSCGGRESHDSSANTNHSHHDDSSETSVQMPSVPVIPSAVQQSLPAVHLQASLVHQLPPAAQVPSTKGNCSAVPAAATYSDVARLYKALDVVLQRPVVHAGHEHNGYTVQRAMLVAKLNHLKSQLDGSCCESNMDDTIMACQPHAACTTAPGPPSGQVPMQPCGSNVSDFQQYPYAHSHSHAPQQIQLPPLSTASFSSSQWPVEELVTGPSHPQDLLQYPASSAYAEAAVERLRSAGAPPQRPLSYSLADTCTSSSMELGASRACSTLPSWQRQQSINQNVASQMVAGQANFSGLPSPVKHELDGAWSCQPGNLSQTLPGVIPPEAADNLHFAVPELPYACGLPSLQAQPAAAVESSLEETCKMLRPPSFPCGLDFDDIGPWNIDDSIILGIEDANGSNESSLADLDPTSWLQF